MKIIITEEQFSKLINESAYGNAVDTRFWEVWNDQKFVGLYAYGDLLGTYDAYNLNQALNKLKTLGYTWEIVDDLYPLEKPSIYPEVRALKAKYLKKEKEKEKQRAKSKGFKLMSIVP